MTSRTYPQGVPCWVDTEQPDIEAATAAQEYCHRRRRLRLTDRALDSGRGARRRVPPAVSWRVPARRQAAAAGTCPWPGR
jgi:hypothetical protein